MKDRIHHVFEQSLSAIRKRTNRLFLLIFGLQWSFAVAFAWNFALHFYLAVILGGLVTSLPTYLILKYTAAKLQADLRSAYNSMENNILERTRELTESRALILEQQNLMVASAKNAALGEMAGQAAHEINTPLGALMLTAQSLESKLEANLIDRTYFRKQVSQIIAITSKMARIISSLRKMAGHGTNGSYSSMPVKDFVEDLVLLCEGRFSKNAIALDIKYNGLEDMLFQGRTNEISQILMNLFNNANDAIREHSEKWVCLDITSNGDKIRFAVSDSGPGISPTIHDKIFQPNFSTKSLAHGTGFGLSISRTIAEKHSGSLIFDPQSRNTRFVLELPKVAS